MIEVGGGGEDGCGGQQLSKQRQPTSLVAVTTFPY